MGTRVQFHSLLLLTTGINSVYFQSPDNCKLTYPCVIYERSRNKTIRSDNRIYQLRKAYTVTVIDYDPDCEIADRIEQLPYTEFDRHFVADNLHHYVYTIFY